MGRFYLICTNHLRLIDVECLQRFWSGKEHLLKTLILPLNAGTEGLEKASLRHKPQPITLPVKGDDGIKQRE